MPALSAHVAVSLPAASAAAGDAASLALAGDEFVSVLSLAAFPPALAMLLDPWRYLEGKSAP